ncbi:Rho GTPase-activating protein 18 [Orchesella cincta]|uniref:Rho GTPase-activating protein 18 n=1 Tax=Orchesella cincta TaxID=48709 RepID=A0A1D2N0N8_ORCCI|nr:Rho GTPase-activating protein 18 [Orchesella cincta]
MSVTVEIGKKPSALPVTVTVNHETMEEEFWAEAANNERYEDEEHKGNVTDEGELEADWLSEVGLGEWTQQWRQGKSLPENDIGPAVQKLSLKPHQADALRRRIQTLNATLKKRRKMRRPPDIRGFFQSDISENKDSSRSATPDSLDSNEYPSDSPPRRTSSPTLRHHRSQSNSADELDENTGSPNHVPNFVSIFAHDQHHQPSQTHHSLGGQPASTSPPSRNKDLFKSSQLRFPVIGNFSTTDGEVASDVINGIEILGYHNVGTIYMKGYIPAKKHVSQAAITQSPASLPSQPQIGGTLSQEVSTKTFSPFIPAKSGGFTAELNRINGGSLGHDMEEDDCLDEEPPADPSGVTRLSDLSEEDAKGIRPILLMELTAQCDYSQIQVRKRKVQKNLKKNLSGEDTSSILFGIPLEVLLLKDRQVTGDNSLEVPIIFEKLVSHLWKRSLSEQGLLRMAGQRAKINDLRATFESSLYSEPEQVDAAMNQCSSHDVANLLKQFLRELPVPLLGFEYIDTFFDVADKLRGRNLETCLRLLILLLPQSHQAVLRQLLQFLRELVKNSDSNKMGIKNVSLIVAPNLVPTSALGSQNKELSRAATWVKLTQTLIRYGSSLFVIPSDLLSQLRQINDRARIKRAKAKNNGNGGNGKSNVNGSAAASGCKSAPCSILRISAPQLGFPEVVLPIGAGSTAGDIVLSLLEEADKKAESLEKEAGNGLPQPGNNNVNQGVNGAVRRRQVPKAAEINKNGPNLSCLLTRMNPDMALKTHALYEIGGNIGYRRVDPAALVPSICRDNPAASWVLRCNHRHSANI